MKSGISNRTLCDSPVFRRSDYAATGVDMFSITISTSETPYTLIHETCSYRMKYGISNRTLYNNYIYSYRIYNRSMYVLQNGQ